MRRSLSGPLTVIAVGVLFLLNNFYPDIFTFRSLFRLWPFLLIGLGVIRLLEVLLDAARSKPLAPSHISILGTVMLVLACFLFWGVSKGARTTWHHLPAFRLDMNSANVFGDEFDFDVQQSMPVTVADTRLVLEGIKGSVSIAGDDVETVSINGHRMIRAFGHGAADSANRHSQIELVRNGTDIVLRSSGASDTNVTYDVDVRVPRRMNLGSQAGTENVTVESLDGGVDLSNDTGNVRLSSIGGNVRVETIRRKDLVRAVGIKGKLDLRGTGTDVQIEDVAGLVTIQGNYFGTLDFRNLAKALHFESEQTDLRVEKLPGSISMDLGDFRAENIVGPLHLRCESRDVHVSNFNNEMDVNVERGDVELNPQQTPLAKMDVHVRAGDIDLTLPEKSPFALHASTDQGDVDNQYGDALSTNSEGRSASMKSASSSGPSISLTTGRGNITVKK